MGGAVLIAAVRTRWWGVTLFGFLDVIATALALVGVPLPDDLDGRVWTESIDATPTFVERGPQGGGGGRGPSDPSLERSLRKLGYLRST